MNRIKGFTLIELMVVLALVAIIATIAVPSFNSLIRHNRLESQAEELNSLLQYARSEALIRKVRTRVEIDTVTGDITVGRDSAGATIPEESTLRKSSLQLNSISLAASTSTVRYLPTGASSTPNFRAIFCTDDNAEEGRLLTVSGSGATQLHHKGQDSDGTALGGCTP